MAGYLLLDTDLLIDYLRGCAEAVTYLAGRTEPLLISAITVAALYAGVRDGPERVKLDAFVQAFDVVSVDSEVALQGGLYRRDYGKSHRTGLADALIAVAAEVRQATLVTLNRKHFPMLANVIVPYSKSQRGVAGLRNGDRRRGRPLGWAEVARGTRRGDPRLSLGSPRSGYNSAL